MKTFLLAVCIFICSSTFAHATTASELLRKCQGESIKECSLFVEGVVSGIRSDVAQQMGAMRAIYLSLAGGSEAEKVKRAFGFIPALCMRPDLSTDAVVKVVLDYAKKKPLDAKTSAGELVFDAVQDEFGCNVQF